MQVSLLTTVLDFYDSVLVVGKVIGKKGNTIQGIMEKSRVLNVKIMGDNEAKKMNVDTKDKVSCFYRRFCMHTSLHVTAI